MGEESRFFSFQRERERIINKMVEVVGVGKFTNFIYCVQDLLDLRIKKEITI